jgi:hypothetical protein
MAGKVKSGSSWLIAVAAAGALVVGVLGADTIKHFFNPSNAEMVGLLSVREVNRLEVLQARFAGIATTPTCTTLANICVPGTNKVSIMIAPGDVGYFVDFTGLSEGSFVWNDEKAVLTVTLPNPTVSKPNIDMRQVRAYTDGTPFTWDSMSELGRRTNEDKIYNDIVKQAQDKMMLDRARSSAQVAVEKVLGFTLRQRGFSNAEVDVKFAP